MNREDIFKKVVNLFATMTEEEEIYEDSELMEDLGIDSMDVLYLISCLENEFGCKVPEKEIRKMYTIGDVIDIIDARFQ